MCMTYLITIFHQLFKVTILRTGKNQAMTRPKISPRFAYLIPKISLEFVSKFSSGKQTSNKTSEQTIISVVRQFKHIHLIQVIEQIPIIRQTKK